MAFIEGHEKIAIRQAESLRPPSPRGGLASLDLESGLDGPDFPGKPQQSESPRKSQKRVYTVSVSCIESAPPPTPLATVRGVELGARVDISFKGIGFTAKAKNGGRLDILRHVSGICKGGRLMAIAGPSGAGKVSLTRAFLQKTHKQPMDSFLKL